MKAVCFFSQGQPCGTGGLQGSNMGEGTGEVSEWSYTPRTPLQGCIRTEGTSEVAPEPLDRRLEEVAEVVGGGYCRLQMPLKQTLPSGRQWLGVGWAPWRGEGGTSPLPMHPPPPQDQSVHRGKKRNFPLGITPGLSLGGGWAFGSG